MSHTVSIANQAENSSVFNLLTSESDFNMNMDKNSFYRPRAPSSIKSGSVKSIGLSSMNCLSNMNWNTKKLDLSDKLGIPSS